MTVGIPLGTYLDGDTALWMPTTCPHLLVAACRGNAVDITSISAALCRGAQAARWATYMLAPRAQDPLVREHLARAGVRPRYLAYERGLVHALIDAVRIEVTRRYRVQPASTSRMTESPIVLVVDDIAATIEALSSTEQGWTEVSTDQLWQIIRLGRAVNVHVAVFAHNHRGAQSIPGEVKSNLLGRYILGTPDTAEALSLLRTTHPPTGAEAIADLGHGPRALHPPANRTRTSR